MKRMISLALAFGIFLSPSVFAEAGTAGQQKGNKIQHVKSEENYDYGSDTVYLIKDAETREIIPLSIGPLDGYSYAYLSDGCDFTVEKVTYQTPFNDLGEKYQYESYIHEISARGVVVGFSDGSFKPDQELTRAEMATVFARMFRIYGQDAVSSFEDISQDHWAKDSVMALVQRGVFMRDKKFNPNEPITREQLVAMSFRMLSDMGMIEPREAEMDFSKYKDLDQVTDYAKTAYRALTAEGYLLFAELVDHDFMDTADDEFYWYPQKTVTRMECCEFLYQLIRMFFYNNAPAIKREEAPEIEIPVLDGSTSTYPITQNIYQAFYQNHKNAAGFPKSHSKTVESYKRLIDGVVEMIFVPDAGEDVIAYAREKGVELKFIPIANEALVFFTGAENQVDNITTEQLHEIYVNNGIANWKELGGGDAVLAAYCRNEDSGSHAQMEQFILDGQEINENIARERTSLMMSSILTEVDDHNKKNKGEYAVGYSLYYYYHNVSMVLGPLDLKLMHIDGVAPTEATIAEGNYPYTTNYYAVIRDGEENPKVTVFAELMQGEFGDQIAEMSGLGVIR